MAHTVFGQKILNSVFNLHNYMPNPDFYRDNGNSDVNPQTSLTGMKGMTRQNVHTFQK